MRTRIWHSDWKPRWLIRCVPAALLSFMDKQVRFYPPATRRQANILHRTAKTCTSTPSANNFLPPRQDSVIARTRRRCSPRRAGPAPRSGSSPQPYTACVSCAEYPEPFSPPGRSCSLISVSSSFPSVTTMSQKSSVMQLPQFVPKALTSDRLELGLLLADETPNLVNL